MNYDVFSEENLAKNGKRDDEIEQQFMERCMFQIFDDTDSDNGDQFKVGLNNNMSPSFVSCDAKNRSVRIRFKVKPWELNPSGNLHGGIIASSMDCAFGLLGRFYARSNSIVTVQLNIEFMRGIAADSTFDVEARVTKNGRRVKFMSAYITNDEGKIAAQASAVFM